MSAILSVGGLSSGTQSSSEYNGQVVSLSITHQPYDHIKPWMKRTSSVRTANAVVVEGPLLLTTARMVEDATLIQVRKHGRPGKIPARMVHVDRESNLSLVAVDKDGFFEDLQPVLLAQRLATAGVVRSVRWQNRQLEISSSRIRRIEVRASATGSVEQAHLILMTDFTDGGWAEPVFSDEGLLGLTTSQSSRNVTGVLPIETINTYLEGLPGGKAYRGLGVFGIYWQINRDRAVAGWLGMEGEPYGVIIRKIPRGVTGDGILRPRDVLVSLGGHDIDADGFYMHPYYGRLRFMNILTEGYGQGDTVDARVLREGVIADVALKVRGFPADLPLVPQARPNHAPAYIVAGGLVFRELDTDFLRSHGKDWRSKANPRLVALWSLEGWAQTAGRRRIIILTYVLPDSYNVGYHNLNNLIVSRVNGYAIDSISDMQDAFHDPKDGLHTVTFIPNSQRGQIVLDAVEFEAATERILKLYSIPQGTRLEEDAPPAL